MRRTYLVTDIGPKIKRFRKGDGVSLPLVAGKAVAAKSRALKGCIFANGKFVSAYSGEGKRVRYAGNIPIQKLGRYDQLLKVYREEHQRHAVSKDMLKEQRRVIDARDKTITDLQKVIDEACAEIQRLKEEQKS